MQQSFAGYRLITKEQRDANSPAENGSAGENIVFSKEKPSANPSEGFSLAEAIRKTAAGFSEGFADIIKAK